jgi:hypothetical protein
LSPDYVVCENSENQVQAMSCVDSHIIESRLCRVENLQTFSPGYVVQAMSYVETLKIEYRLCSPGYVDGGISQY